MSSLNSGLSGCKLEILDNMTIRKYSSTPEYNYRLSLQCDKQVLFSNLILRNIDIPKIYSIKKDNLYFFDMEYVCGVSFVEYFSTSNSYEIDFIVNTLFEYFDFLISTKRDFLVNTQISEKIRILKNNTKYINYLHFLEQYVLKNDIIIPKTFCHGDLTFSNILFHKNRLFFIDFLDSYVDSFICDLVKLKQDLFYFWNLKINDCYSLRIAQIYRYIWNKINYRYFLYINQKSFDIFDALNLLRIEPYLTSDYHRDILNQLITESKLYEEFNNTYGREIF